MRKIILTTILLLFLFVPSKAQRATFTPDSLKKGSVITAFEFPALFIVSGLTLYGKPGKDFQSLRNGISPGFSTKLDDYFQYSPVALLYGLKIAGVEGRSSWKRLIVTNAISGVAMAAIVNGMKYTIKEPRPDGSENNGFPSGHTALAFMSANMIHHEYGLTRSPWYSAAAFGLASTTAVMRVLNNSHYVHQVLMGAGVGILSTELGYIVADAIFKERGNLRAGRNRVFGATDEPYSYLGTSMGYNKIINRINVSGVGLKSGWGATASLDGAWYLNNKWGIGINASANNASTSLATQIWYSSFLPYESIMGVTTPDLNWYTISTGPRISARAGNIFRYGAGIDLGYSHLKQSLGVSFPINAQSGFFLGGSIFAERALVDGILLRLYAKSDNSFFGNGTPDLSSLVLGWSVAINLGN